MSLNKTKIEWCDYTVNPVKGKCPMACPYCYARRLYDRFKWNPRLRYDPSAWLGLGSLKKPSHIFVGSTIELFHKRIKPRWRELILEVPVEFPQHTFMFLTKQPQNLPEEWPDNCWVGVTATNNYTWLGDMVSIKAKVKFISFEPLLDWRNFPAQREQLWDILGNKLGINWIIIGAQTNPYKPPKIEWVREIVEAADKAGVSVFLKDNLKTLLTYEKDRNIYAGYMWATNGHNSLRQEVPA